MSSPFYDVDFSLGAQLLFLPFVQQSTLLGNLTIQLQIPGVYNGFVPNMSGRCIVDITGRFDNPVSGDSVMSVTLQDINTVINDGYQVNFPNYPILASFIDPGTPQGVGVPLNQNGESTPLAQLYGNPKFLPSGIFLVVVLKKGNGLQDWFRGRLRVLLQLSNPPPNGP